VLVPLVILVVPLDENVEVEVQVQVLSFLQLVTPSSNRLDKISTFFIGFIFVPQRPEIDVYIKNQRGTFNKLCRGGTGIPKTNGIN
jgi:hypothetical protein